MASLQIRDMPDDLYELLKKRAEQNHRSLAHQAIVMLSKALENESRGMEHRAQILREIRAQKIETISKNIDVTRLIREDRDR